jgi:hypothetical protein
MQAKSTKGSFGRLFREGEGRKRRFLFIGMKNISCNQTSPYSLIGNQMKLTGALLLKVTNNF